MNQDGADAAPQSLLTFFLTTWSGRLILVNGVIFAFMSWASGSLSMPTNHVLDVFGAKDVVAIAQGQWWRLITAMFLHIGMIHFLFNSYAIYVIGPQIETLIGARWFIVVYLLSGVFGNVCSALYSVSVSAGASGAILGLLGCGLFIELSIRKRMQQWTGTRPKAGAYLINTIGIAILGVLVPNIDNAAHFGGLAAGYVCGFALLRMIPNRLLAPSPTAGMRILIAICLATIGGAVMASQPEFVVNKYLSETESSTDFREKVYLTTRALVLAPQNTRLYFERGSALIVLGDMRNGLADLASAASDPSLVSRIEDLAVTLDHSGRATDAEIIRSLILSQHTRKRI